MRPANRFKLRTRLRDVAAAAAFASIGLSGSVPAAIVVMFCLSFVLSMVGKRILQPFFKSSAVALLLLGGGLFFMVFRGGLDLIVAACSFATLVSCHRMLSEQTARTDLQVHLSSLLMMAGGAAIANDIWFGVCLLVFAATASFALALTVIEGPVENTEDVPLRPVARALGFSVTLAFVGALVFFVFFPRLSWNIATRRSPEGLGGATGMSDRVRLGGGGDIKTSARVVARVRLSPDPQSDRLDAYWVGRLFDTYRDGEWLGHGKASPPSSRVRLAPFSLGVVRQFVTLLPSYESRTLIALEPAVWFQNAMASSTTTSNRAAMVRVEDEEVHIADNGNAFTYEAFSTDGAPLPIDDAIDLRPYRAVPANIDPRVAALAAQIIGDEKDPRKAAARLTRHLQRNFAYTLELPGDVVDPLAHFLFERKEGHCEHFASALTLMLRTQGFAARVAAGFFGGERVADQYVLRAGDAHAWSQVFVPGTGWQTFDATPESGRGGQSPSLLSWVTRAYEEVDNWWRTRVMDYSLIDQVSMVRTWVRPPRQTAAASAGGPRAPPARALGVAAVLGVLTYALFFVITRRADKRTHPASSFLDDLEKRVEKAKLAQRMGEPLEDIVKRLRVSQHPLAQPFERATLRYLEARFGGKPLASNERSEQLRQLDAALTAGTSSPTAPNSKQR